VLVISQEYQEQIATLHKNDPRWGTTGRLFAPQIEKLIQDFQPKNILDYGCGKQTLARSLPRYRIIGYDPAIPGLEAPPEPVDMVISTDVLEHIEPEFLDDVLDDLQRVTKEILFATVSVLPANAVLPDGRNAHLIVEPLEWWLPKLMDRFGMINLSVNDTMFQVVMKAKKPKGNGAG
jgi:2-polyprenyl-3-methyl-5-hydroxy-6-metoxy-1,4-benzoquinol methylase